MSEVDENGREQLASRKTLGEILDVAISFEKTARDFYRDLAPRVGKNIRWLVEELVQEEQHHYDLFSQLKQRDDIERHLAQEISIPASDRRFSDAVLLPDLGVQPDDQDVLRYALYREHTAMEQYQSLAEATTPGAIHDLFLFLAKEEAEHKNELEKLYYEVVHSGGV